MFYDHRRIEKKWQKFWLEKQTFKSENPKIESQSPKTNSQPPKFYVLDMFPYPSGAGLHVGHPLGYIASDIYARFKRHQGFNVLHPIGYDSFGLPAEQYAIQTGQHPAITTEQNIARYEEQLKKIGFSFDWNREIRTSDPSYYKWTQWIFIELFHSWYNKNTDKAEPISTLIQHFEISGTEHLNACETEKLDFDAEDWNTAPESEKQDILLNYRMAYRSETTVNWCPALGTVLANDEVKDGKSERGGFPVYQKKMMQWSMRISAYSERLLQGLNKIDWPQPLKDSQEYWIGKSMGAEIKFHILTPDPSPKERGDGDVPKEKPHFLTGGDYSRILLQHAKNMRHQPTEAEDTLWQFLRNRNLRDKFRRQHLIEDYIVDFVCLEKKLVIEVDGEHHHEKEQKEFDELRTKYLNFFGYKVLRFNNKEVIENLTDVLKKIKSELQNSSYVRGENKAPLSFGEGLGVRIFTTRPDTIFGATFMVLAPEHPLVQDLTTDEQKSEIENYISETSKKTERDRLADVKTVSGAFTGSFAENPFTGKKMPIYISDYVLMSYGTGAVMAVPAHDERDHRFAKKFGLEITKVVETDVDVQQESFDSKDSVCINSDFLNGLNYENAKSKIIQEIENQEIGFGTINYKQRDAVFSRQRYWGEPVPIYYKNKTPYTLPISALPLELPEVENYKPTENGDPPLGNAKKWHWLPDDENSNSGKVVSEMEWEASPLGRFGGEIELSTMPGWAGSSWYFLRYMDPENSREFCAKDLSDYWGQVDLYIGGSEHATGHLLYSRFWNMFLKDRGWINQDEPFKKLINQGMILGMSAKIFQLAFNYLGDDNSIEIKNELIRLVSDNPQVLISATLAEKIKNKETDDWVYIEDLDEHLKNEIIKYFDLKDSMIENFVVSKYLMLYPEHIDIKYVDANNNLDIENLLNDPRTFTLKKYNFIKEKNGDFKAFREVEKMSKSKYNVVNPDDICEEYGADCLRLYEMFLGPIEQSKPWNTQGLSGVYGFLKRFYNLYFDGDAFSVSDDEPTKAEYKILHTLIKKFLYDVEHFSFNTSVSQFMIAANELQKLKCRKRKILEPLAVVISPYAPHICEELWENLGHKESIEFASFPELNEEYLAEDEIEYPVSFNGKMKFKLNLPADFTPQQIEESALNDERVIKNLEGNPPKKVIVVPKKVINIVV
ncbi:MAG: class I tRNA ligase family protein [Flavobacteriaceae bacterium]|jgi:leucyl-tRNA synthetase|nr:class I tRNA ligase family protein [Flavobacteriaceae bacterium]